MIHPLAAVVNEASKTIMDIYENKSFGVRVKSDDSPVTVADIAANDIICEGLLKLDASLPFISEENMEIPYDVRRHYPYVWFIDPLDGTKEFMKRNGEFTVNVCLVHEGNPILGMVAAPAEGRLYYAVKGFGAFMEKKGSPACRLACSHFNPMQSGLRIPCSLSHINQDTKSFIQRFNDPVLLGRGSALKFMMIANAEADLYPRLAPTMEWDTAAPQIIVEEAGGTVINYETATPLSYNKESLVNPGFVVYSIVDENE
ncbi:MAG: 3'(2'),5'-bisphosphate nucleotidase CysQ [Saprospiraceae bacterium]|nr:3'(2'),5'-bisphosphate nucleotidase CysQ [Saprospiraceae bacterium]